MQTSLFISKGDRVKHINGSIYVIKLDADDMAIVYSGRVVKNLIGGYRPEIFIVKKESLTLT